MLISDNKIFISFTQEIEKDCWNTSIVWASINFEKINFENIFTPSTCCLFKK